MTKNKNFQKKSLDFCQSEGYRYMHNLIIDIFINPLNYYRYEEGFRKWCNHCVQVYKSV